MNNNYALRVFENSIKRVPAYGKFLEQELGCIPEVKSIDDFYRLPFMSKANYINAFPLAERCEDGTLHGKHSLYHSSGSTGKFTYWLANRETEANYWQNLLNTLDRNFQIRRKQTLAIVSFTLGGSLSGILFAWALRQIGLETGMMTVATPGMDEEATAETIIEFSHRFEQTIIYSYPASAKNIIEYAAKKCPDISKYNIKLMLVGDAFSENFRDSMNKLLGYPYGYPGSISSGYGATDFRAAGTETVLCTVIRRFMHENSKVREVLGVDTIPSLCQINTASIFMEVVDNEIVVTQNNAVPLVRYKTSDRGGLVGYDQMISRLAALGFDPVQKATGWGYDPSTLSREPFVYIQGRKEGSISFRGKLIYIESVKRVIEDDDVLSKLLTGEFQMSVTEDEHQEAFLELAIVPKPGVEIKDLNGLSVTFAEGFARTTGGIYAGLLERKHPAAFPRLRVVSRDQIATSSGLKIKYIK